MEYRIATDNFRKTRLEGTLSEVENTVLVFKALEILKPVASRDFYFPFPIGRKVM
jgi:hypothetical protein